MGAFSLIVVINLLNRFHGLNLILKLTMEPSSSSTSSKPNKTAAVKPLSTLRVETGSRKLSAEGDSDYEDGGPEDESLEMARRSYNQQLSDAFKDGFREGFDKGQIKLAQDVFNESHSNSAKSQLPYGQYLGIIKVLEAKLLKQTSPSEDVKKVLELHNSTQSQPMTRSVLLTRLKALREADHVKQNNALVTLIHETEDLLAKLS